MGDIVDMINEQMIDDSGYDWDYEPSFRRILSCKFCKKPKLLWRKILDQWVMFESDTKIHTCGGYEPPLDILKHMAAEVRAKTQEDIKWRNYERSKKRGGLLKLLPVIPDDQLVDLYACFVRDKQLNLSCPDVGMSFSYDKHIALIHKEIIRRMTR